MIFYMLFESGKLEFVDTMTFTNNEPFKADGLNVSTDFALRFNELGIFLDIYWYDGSGKDGTISTFDDELGINIEHCIRKAGRRIRLVAPEEIDDFVALFRDGTSEVLYVRQENEIVNIAKFRAQEILCYSDDMVKSLNQRALVVFDYLKNAAAVSALISGEEPPDDETIAKKLGYPLVVLNQIRESEIANTPVDYQDNDDCENDESS